MARNAVAVWGQDGAQWLADLPTILQDLTRDWDLTIGAPYDLSYHYVTAATCADGTPAVLKLGVPSGTSLAEEASALAAFDGRGAIRLLRSEPDRGALLLEHVTPGWRARDLIPRQDTEATAAAITVMRRLHVPPPSHCTIPDVLTQATALDDYLTTHANGGGPLPPGYGRPGPPARSSSTTNVDGSNAPDRRATRATMCPAAGTVQVWNRATTIRLVTSLPSHNRSAVPAATRSRPRICGLVAACIRLSTSGKRSNPTPAISESTAPARTSASDPPC